MMMHRFTSSLVVVALLLLCCSVVAVKVEVHNPLAPTENSPKDPQYTSPIVLNAMQQGSALSLRRAKESLSRSSSSTSTISTVTITNTRRVGLWVSGSTRESDARFFAVEDRRMARWMRAEQARLVEAKLKQQQQQQASSEEGGRSGSDVGSAMDLLQPPKVVSARALERFKVMNAPAAPVKGKREKRYTIEQKIQRLAEDVTNMTRRLKYNFACDNLPNNGKAGGSRTTKHIKELCEVLTEYYCDVDAYYRSDSDEQEDKKKGGEDNTPKPNCPVFSMVQQFTPQGHINSSSLLLASQYGSGFLTTILHPLAEYPPVHSVPFFDGADIKPLLEEFALLMRDTDIVEQQLSYAERGSYEDDIALKEKQLQREAERTTPQQHKTDPERGDSSSSARPPSMATAVVDNPNQYYRSLRTYVMTPHVTAPMHLLNRLFSTSLRYVTAIVESSVGLLQQTVLPRLETQLEDIRGKIRLNDGITTAKQRLLKAQNNQLKLIEKDIAGVKKAINHLLRVQQSDPLKFQLEHLPIILQYIAMERRQLPHFALERVMSKAREVDARRGIRGENQDQLDTFHQPLSQSIHKIMYTVFGLTLREAGILVVILLIPSLLDSFFINIPLRCVSFYRLWLRVWVHRLRKHLQDVVDSRQKQPDGKPVPASELQIQPVGILLFFFYKTLIVTISVLTTLTGVILNLFLRIGPFILPVLSLLLAGYIDEWLVAPLINLIRAVARQQNGLTGTGQTITSTIATYRSANTHIWFTIWAFLTGPQVLRLLVVLGAMCGVVSLVVLRPLYKKAMVELLRPLPHSRGRRIGRK